MQAMFRQCRETTRMNLRKPALDPLALEPRNSSGYPQPHRARVPPREKRGANAPAMFTRKDGSKF
jgi:hypothetical protein